MRRMAGGEAAAAPGESKDVPEPYSLWQLVGYMLGLGTWGFGSPVALVG